MWDEDREEYDDGFDDLGDEYAYDDDFEEDADEPTVPCPYCRAEIHEDAQRCPHCEQYISAEDAPPARKPWWIILGAAAALYAALRWIA